MFTSTSTSTSPICQRRHRECWRGQWIARCRRIAVAGLLALAMSACSVNRQLAREADLIVKATVPSTLDARADHCAMESPLRELAETARTQGSAEDPVHFVNVLENGEETPCCCAFT